MANGRSHRCLLFLPFYPTPIIIRPPHIYLRQTDAIILRVTLLMTAAWCAAEQHHFRCTINFIPETGYVYYYYDRTLLTSTNSTTDVDQPVPLMVREPQ